MELQREFDAKAIDEFFRDKPFEWAQIVVTRMALREMFNVAIGTLPLWLADHGVVPFRAMLVGWAACSVPSLHIESAARAASAAIYSVGFGYTGGDRHEKFFRGSGELQSTLWGVQAAAKFATRDADVIQESVARVVWDLFREANNHRTHYEPDFSYVDDCNWLARYRDPASAARVLARRPLLVPSSPASCLDRWQSLSKRLLESDPNYSVWIDWFERRIRGEPAAFDIPGDKRRMEDWNVLRRLAEATDEDFWDKGHEFVNATLKGWLDEAREAADPKFEWVTPDFLDQPEISAKDEFPIPPQSPDAIAYGINRQGKLDRLPHSNQKHLRDEPDQHRVYGDLRKATRTLLKEGQRLGPRLRPALNRFARSMPPRFEDAEVYPIWRDANFLRGLRDAHEAAAKSPEPDEAKLEPIIAVGLGGLIDLYNNFAFADDGLRAWDERRVSPQERQADKREAELAIPVAEAILNAPEMATERARDDVSAQIEIARLSADDPYAAQDRSQGNWTVRNAIAGLLAGAQRYLSSPKRVGFQMTKGAATAVGAAIGGGALGLATTYYPPIVEFVATNAVLLKSYVGVAFNSYPHLPELIDKIKVAWEQAMGWIAEPLS